MGRVSVTVSTIKKLKKKNFMLLCPRILMLSIAKEQEEDGMTEGSVNQSAFHCHIEHDPQFSR